MNGAYLSILIKTAHEYRLMFYCYRKKLTAWVFFFYQGIPLNWNHYWMWSYLISDSNKKQQSNKLCQVWKCVPNTHMYVQGCVYLVVDGNEGVMRGESPCWALTMHQQCFLFTIHHVLLHFSNVMGHIIDHMHIQVIRCGVKHFGESLKGNERLI